MSMPEFTVQFPLAETERLAARFSYAKDDADCHDAGRRAGQRGHYVRNEFLVVCEWKTARSRGRVVQNSEEAVVEATRQAFSSADETERIKSLLTLNGVGVPTASALLFFSFPTDYPILDYRALESLGQPTNRTTYSVRYWLKYLEACRAFAADAQVPIRVLDKALWQASTERG